MSRDQVHQLRALEGRSVNLALRDGSRIDDCQLVSIARGPAQTLWLFTAGMDTFVPIDNVVELWESVPGC